jgi:hypothetical protein
MYYYYLSFVVFTGGVCGVDVGRRAGLVMRGASRATTSAAVDARGKWVSNNKTSCREQPRGYQALSKR